MPRVLCEASLPNAFFPYDLLSYIDLLFYCPAQESCLETPTLDWAFTVGCNGGRSNLPLRIAQLLHGQLLLQTDLLLLLQGEVVKAAA